MSFFFIAISPVIAWRNAPASNEVRLPVTSTSDAGPDWRIAIVKFLLFGGVGMMADILPAPRELGNAGADSASQITDEALREDRGANFPPDQLAQFQFAAKDCEELHPWPDESEVRAQRDT